MASLGEKLGLGGHRQEEHNHSNRVKAPSPPASTSEREN